MPTERQLRTLTRRVCRDFGVEEPTMVFAPGEDAHALLFQREIRMPSYDWVIEHRAARPMGYRLLMLHELAHWLMGKPGVGGTGHTIEFYHLLFHLCAAYGVPVDYALEDELEYKPRSARLGFRRFIDGLYREPSQLTARRIVEDNRVHLDGDTEEAA